MRHVKDAQKLLDGGDSAGALAVIENLLGLAPRNPDALTLKARILDSWGRFDEVLSLFKSISQLSNLSDENIKELELCAAEEKEAFIYSELTAEGRYYYSFSSLQLWISLYGFLGCGMFLLLSPTWLQQGTEGFQQLVLAFLLFVLVPWVALMVVHMVGLKKVLVGMHGIRLCKRFSEVSFGWDKLKVAVVEYDNDIRTKYLKLHLYEKSHKGTPIVSFNVSKERPIVRARRHFVRNILSHVDTVCYISRGAETPTLVQSMEIQAEATGTTNDTSAA